VSIEVTLPEFGLPAKLRVNPPRGLNDEEFWNFCAANPNGRFERTAQGEILIVLPSGGDSSYSNFEAARQLGNWAVTNDCGKGLDSGVAFILPNGAARSPDAAWVSNERLATLSKEERRKFLRLCPEFVIEVMSPSDRLRDSKAKMKEWIANGVQLGWLIDGDHQAVYVYRPEFSVDKMVRPAQLKGEGPVAGFVLELGRIWEGL
jgi:Uma2 family endonuclease